MTVSGQSFCHVQMSLLDPGIEREMSKENCYCSSFRSEGATLFCKVALKNVPHKHS